MEKTIAELDATLILNYIDDDIQIYEPLGTAEEFKQDTSFDENQNPKHQSKSTIVEDTAQKDKDLFVLLENGALSPKKLVPVADRAALNDSKAVKLEATSSGLNNTPEIGSEALKIKKARSSENTKDLKTAKTKKVRNDPVIKDSKKLGDVLPTNILEIPKSKRGRPKRTDNNKLTSWKALYKAQLSKSEETKESIPKDQKPSKKPDRVVETKGTDTSKPKRGRPKGKASSKLNSSLTTTEAPVSLPKNTEENGLESKHEEAITNKESTLVIPKRGRPKGSLSKKVNRSVVPKALNSSKTNIPENREVKFKETDVPVKINDESDPSKIKENWEAEQKNACIESKGLETSKPKRGRPKGVRIKKNNICLVNNDLEPHNSENTGTGIISTVLDFSSARGNLNASSKAVTLKALGLEAKTTAFLADNKLNASSSQGIESKDLAVNTLATDASCTYLVPSKVRRGIKSLKTKKALALEAKNHEVTDLIPREHNSSTKSAKLNVKELNFAMSKINITEKALNKTLGPAKRGRPKSSEARKVNPIAVTVGLEPSKAKETLKRPRDIKSLQSKIVKKKDLLAKKPIAPLSLASKFKKTETRTSENDLKTKKLKETYTKSKESEKTGSKDKQRGVVIIETIDLEAPKGKAKVNILKPKKVNFSNVIGLELSKMKETKKRGRPSKELNVSKTTALVVPDVSKETVVIDSEQDDVTEIIQFGPSKFKPGRSKGPLTKRVETLPTAIKMQPKKNIVTIGLDLLKPTESGKQALEVKKVNTMKKTKDAGCSKPEGTNLISIDVKNSNLNLTNSERAGLKPPKYKPGRPKGSRTKNASIRFTKEQIQPKENIVTIDLDFLSPTERGEQALDTKKINIVKKTRDAGSSKIEGSNLVAIDVENSNLNESKAAGTKPSKYKPGRPKGSRTQKGSTLLTKEQIQLKENAVTIDLDVPNVPKIGMQTLESKNITTMDKTKEASCMVPVEVGKQNLESSSSREEQGKRKLSTSEGSNDFKFPRAKRVKKVKPFMAPKDTKPAKSEETEATFVEQKQSDVAVGTSDLEPPKIKETEVPKKPMVCTVGTQTLDIPEEEDEPKPAEEKSLEGKISVNSVGTQVMEPTKLKSTEVKNLARKPPISAAEVVDLATFAVKNAESQKAGGKKLGSHVGRKSVESVSLKHSKTSESLNRDDQNNETIKTEEISFNSSALQPNALEEGREFGVKYETVEQIHTEFKYESQSEAEVMRKRRGLFRSMRGRRRGKLEARTKIDNYIRIVDLDGKIQMKCNQIFKCDHCLYVGNSKANLERHSLIHRNPDEIIWFHCTECPYKSKYEHQLKSHFLIHMKPDDIEFFQCPHCDLKCSRKHNLNNHVRSMHTHRDNSFKCLECDYATFSRDRLVAHVKKHSNEVHACTKCKFVTKRKEYLESHFKAKHTEVVARPFPCDTCSYKGKTKRELDKHYDRMHNKEQMHVYQCNHCSFNSIYKKNLEFHLLHMHNNSEGFQKFICGHCHKTFSYKNGLKVHIIRCHIKLPDDCWHKCLECKYKSKDVSTLKRHIKRTHGAPRLHCQQCSFATNRQVSMDAHMKTHEYDNEDILKCPECPYRIIQMTSFLYHMKVIHGKPITAKESEQYYMQDE